MSVNITLPARVVRQADISATLKSFIAVLAPFLVVWNAGVFGIALHTLSAMRDSDFDPEDALMYGGFVVLGLIGILAPLGFVLADWVARRESGRQLAAITGALIGYLGLALLGAAGAGLLQLIFEDTDSGAAYVAAFFALPLSWLVIWLLSSQRAVRIIGWIMAIAFVAVIVLVLGQESYDEDASITENLAHITTTLFVVLAAAAITYAFVRAIRFRIILSASCPRTLFLGAILRRGLWPRLAFLAGLPSSLWSANAMLTSAFWLLCLARPITYLGAVYVRRVGDDGISDWTRPLIGGVALIAAGHLMLYGGKRLAARRIWKPQDRSDPRPPILFLRSFEDDQLNFKSSRWNLVGRWLDLWSFRRNIDETLIDEMAQYGPVVALGRPGERTAPFGAQRYQASHEEWQTIVTETARRAQAIVIVAGDSPGVLWEFDLLVKEQLLDRTLLLFRPGDEAISEMNLRALRAFSAKAASSHPVQSVEKGMHMIGLLSSRHDPQLLVTTKPVAAAYVLVLRAHFQSCDLRGFEWTRSGLDAPLSQSPAVEKLP